MHLDSANDTIGTMNRNEFCMKCALYLVILVLFLAILAVLYIRLIASNGGDDKGNKVKPSKKMVSAVARVVKKRFLNAL